MIFLKKNKKLATLNDYYYLNRDNRSIVFQEMIHYAPQGFFTTRQSQWDDFIEKGYSILGEKVIPDTLDDKTKTDLNYYQRFLAKELGLTIQQWDDRFIHGDITLSHLNEEQRVLLEEALTELKTINELVCDHSGNKLLQLSERKDIEKRLAAAVDKVAREENPQHGFHDGEVFTQLDNTLREELIETALTEKHHMENTMFHRVKRTVGRLMAATVLSRTRSQLYENIMYGDVQQSYDKWANMYKKSKPLLTGKIIEGLPIILDYRNKHLYKKVQEHDGDIVLPWGASHYHGVKELLEKDGYKLVDTRTINIMGEVL